YFLPLMVMLVRVSSRAAPPLKRPAGFASFTMPVAGAPLGITTLPSTSTGSSTVAEKVWPDVAVLELRASSVTTAIFVSAGTTMGSETGAGARAGAGAEESGEAKAEAAEPESAGVDCESADFCQPMNSNNSAGRSAPRKRRFM